MAEETTSNDQPAAPVDDSAEMSVAEFEAQYESGTPPPPDPNPEPEENVRRPPRERDEETGKFVKPEPGRHRAKSQQASAADVPRIRELTSRLREVEAERDRLKAAPSTASATSPPGPTPAATAPPAPVARPATPPPAAAVKPKIEQFQDYDAFVDALTDWKIGEARRLDREQAHQEAKQARKATNWRDRVADAKSRHADFEQVALLSPTRIPQGSLVDAWILEHRSGADVLYTLQQNPSELDRILALPLFDQVEALTLLGQRNGQTTREPAVRTGAAATPPVKVAPRPPTPVRTAAPSAPDEPPDPETASLAEFERYYHRPRA